MESYKGRSYIQGGLGGGGGGGETLPCLEDRCGTTNTKASSSKNVQLPKSIQPKLHQPKPEPSRPTYVCWHTDEFILNTINGIASETRAVKVYVCRAGERGSGIGLQTTSAYAAECIH